MYKSIINLSTLKVSKWYKNGRFKQNGQKKEKLFNL